jgi:hypothetical protein
MVPPEDPCHGWPGADRQCLARQGVTRRPWPAVRPGCRSEACGGPLVLDVFPGHVRGLAVARALREVHQHLVSGDVPVPEPVANACGFLGLDPLYVANEGRLVAFVPREHADAVLAAMREHPRGRGAAVIGECVAEHPGMVVARTGLGGTRVVDLPLGEQLPRIC